MNIFTRKWEMSILDLLVILFTASAVMDLARGNWVESIVSAACALTTVAAIHIIGYKAVEFKDDDMLPPEVSEDFGGVFEKPIPPMDTKSFFHALNKDEPNKY